MSGFNFDTREFERKLTKLVKNTMPDLTEKGLGKAGLQVLNDCLMQAPTVPLKEGTLRGSGSVFVQNKFIGMSERTRKKGTPTRSLAMPLKSSEFVAVIGFNTKYAAIVHERPKRFTEPSSGNKYLSLKLSKNKNLYMEIVSDTIKKGAI